MNFKTINTNKIIPPQPPENENDNREYKRHLIPIENNNFFYQKKAVQMQYRLHVGNGKALYLIGIEDNGSNRGISDDYLNKSIKNINKIAEIISADIKSIRIYQGLIGKVASVRIENDIPKNIFIL